MRIFMSTTTIPKAFIRRRLHSLLGLWLVLFLTEHLLTNSQAALWIGEDGQGFVRMVNAIHNFPYLQIIELTLIGIPLLLHMTWGVQYALRAKSNAKQTDGSAPSLPKYGRNRAYSWQRITSWILLVCLISHVVKFRFLAYPDTIQRGNQTLYVVTLHADEGLHTLAQRLGVVLSEEEEDVIRAESSSFGTATLLTVRDTFKQPVYLVLYTLFVLAACFHAFNGLWTFLLSWGFIIRRAAQKSFLRLSIGLMFVIAFLGLAAIWGSWFNLRG